jgi:copper chaperone
VVNPDINCEENMSTELSVLVEGMTCGHCVRSVTSEVEALEGVDEVTIDLVPDGQSTLRVVGSHSLDADALEAAVEAAGYAVVPAA